MSELRKLKNKEYLFANNYTLHTEQNGIKIYNKFVDGVNYIVSTGIMKYPKEKVLEFISSYEIKQKVDKMFDRG